MYVTYIARMQFTRIIATVANFITQCHQEKLGIINFSGRKSVAAKAAPAATVPTPMEMPKGSLL